MKTALATSPLKANKYTKKQNRYDIMKFDLLELHDSSLDDKPKKWICANGKNLSDEIRVLISTSTKLHKISRAELSRIFAKKLNVSVITTERLVYQRREWVPLIFIKELLKLANKEKEKFQIIDKIEFLKASQPPLKIVKASKELTVNLCKIAGAHAADGTVSGNYFCITDGHRSNLIAFRDWVKNEFEFESKVTLRGKNEWAIAFHGKVFSRYLTKILKFPDGDKCKTVKMPKIIKNSNKECRKAFTLGALNFDGGIGMKHQVELCVSSKNFMEDISMSLNENRIKHVKMSRPSCSYWRLWSGTLNKEEAKKWLQMFEPKTEKWHKLNDSINGFTKKVKSFEETLQILNKTYPHMSSSKVSLKNVLLQIKKLGYGHRYKIVDCLKKDLKIESYGGKWGHSLRHYLDILKAANMITVEKRRFGKKKSFGTIMREVYIYNPNIAEWVVPERQELGEVS